MKRMAVCTATVLILVLAVSAAAAERTAKLVGFEKGAMVSGTVILHDDGSLEITRFASVYDTPLEVYVSRGYDYLNASFAGVLTPGFSGETTLRVDIMDVVDVDMVFVTTPAWPSPVGLGLFRAPGGEPSPDKPMPAAETPAAAATAGDEPLFDVVPPEESQTN